MVEIVVVSRAKRQVVDDQGRQWPITQFFDSFGEEVDDPEEAVTCVAGVEPVWFAINLTMFQKAVWH